MIQYRSLLIQDGKLTFTLRVEPNDYYSNIHIIGARIDTPNTYGTEYPYESVSCPPTTIMMDSVTIPSIDKLLLIVTPIIEGAPGPDTPCGKDIVDVRAIYNHDYISEKGLGYLKELGNSCTIPKGFIDYILKVKALDMSLATCNYLEAIKYWNYLTGKSVNTATNNCGCHGLN